MRRKDDILKNGAKVCSVKGKKIKENPLCSHLLMRQGKDVVFKVQKKYSRKFYYVITVL